MNQQQAQTIAGLYDGKAIQWVVGCDEWQVIVRRNDDSLVMFHDDMVVVYSDVDAFDSNLDNFAIEFD